MSSKTVEEAWAFYMTTVPPDDRYDTPTGDFVSGYNQGRAAGVAHGEARERELFNALRSGVMTCRSTGAGGEYYVRIDFKELTGAQNLHHVLARIRQRGEK